MKKFRTIILLMCLFIPFCFAGCENKNKETLSTPVIVDINGGTIIFEQVPSAQYYTLSINDKTLTLDIAHNSNIEIIDNKINFDASNIFVIGDSYSVKVMANAADKYNSAYSNIYSYKHNGNIEKPANLKINGTTLTWDTIENASYYIVKIITPSDNIIFDKQGNIISTDDSSSIEQADLTEYSFNTNQFDFGSILNKAGNYKFYVSAVLSVGSSYIESGYSAPVKYSHILTLSTPQNSSVQKQGNDLYFVSCVDINANAISIVCNNVEKTVEINGSNPSIVSINENLLNINISKYFQPLVDAGKLNFEDLSQFSFKTQSKYIANSPEESFYLNSEYSDFVYFENTTKIATPSITLEQDNVNNCYVARWQTQNNNLISEYKLIVCTATEIKEYVLDKDISSKLIYGDFISVAIKAIGVGNVESSEFSDFVSVPTLPNITVPFVANITGQSVSWNTIAGAYYIVEFAGKYYKTNSANFTININEIPSSNFSVKVTAIKTGSKHISVMKNITTNVQLASPVIAGGQGFVSSNLYELTFTKVNNAFGYYIYLKTKDSSTFEKIDKLYTTNRIDLSNYICSEGNYKDYEVKIQAVADPYSHYVDSELSRAITVSHIKALNKPQFYKLGNTITPVTKLSVGNSYKYILKFYGVASASSYEVLINYNKISVSAKSNLYTGLYEVDISNYLVAANNYEIKVRAIPSNLAFNIQASEFNVAEFALRKQLPMVENVKVSSNEGIYSLTFDPVDNAESYRIRVVKESDNNYVSYLNSLGLSNTFEVKQSVDVTEFVKNQGVYYFYITALASQKSYYADSIESSNFGYVSKLTTLDAPANITHTNISKISYLLNWEGDVNADYYSLKITNPNNIVYDLKIFATNNSLQVSTDINRYLTVPGTYYFSISSKVLAVGDKAKEFTSSQATEQSLRYIYQSKKDFERYSVSMNGKNYDFSVDSINDLKNLLWYHYLYELNVSNKLRIMINPQITENGEYTASLRESILQLSIDANKSLIYNFNNDEQWLNLIETNATDTSLFQYLSSRILEAYPEFNILETINCTLIRSANDSTPLCFEMYYKNALNKEKSTSSQQTFTNTNYGNDYKYIDLYSRKSATGSFAIDSKEEAFVTTTEELIQVVQYNKKPKFVGDCETAETVYSNAKLVLSAIVSNNMSDMEKATAIFEWLESSYDLTYYKQSGKNYVTGSVEKDGLANYGLNKIYYLEGMLYNISLDSYGNIVVGSRLATSQSYAKAYALLCSIEGIECIVVNGNYTYLDSSNDYAEQKVAHSWNKININASGESTNKSWYAVDLTFSDNRIIFNDFVAGYGISSHAYFLTTDTILNNNLNISELNYMYDESRKCESAYNYYSDSRFALTYEQIANTINDFAITQDDTILTTGFSYTYEYSPSENYQLYSKTSGYGNLQSFLLNAMIYAKYNADINKSNRSVFEFKFNKVDNGNSSNFNITTLQNIFDTAPNHYGLKIKLISEANNSLYSMSGDSTGSSTIVIFAVENTE